ncbi:hypothetical protein KSP40_PGU009309 [Platanthera guangdongensis]|uniref:BRCT domain-containing protein n=1 Tax=Platanthera guangdongensis TaxID=2320717 RepID=A0ABR2LH38_9ASPA
MTSTLCSSHPLPITYPSTGLFQLSHLSILSYFSSLLSFPSHGPHLDSFQQPSPKRSLPSWMSSTEDRKKSQKKQNETSNKILLNNEKEENITSACVAIQNNCDFSKLLEGVVFVLSGFVNPERGTLRAQAVEMGAEYQADWNSGCTLLICAFPNTPKFRQVETDCGTIVSKEWILECYKHKKLVEIERYLMYVGKPWRRSLETSTSLQNPVRLDVKRDRSIKINFSGYKFLHIVVDALTRTIIILRSHDVRMGLTHMTLINLRGNVTCLDVIICSKIIGGALKRQADHLPCLPRVACVLARFRNASVSHREAYRFVKRSLRIKEDNDAMILSGRSDGWLSSVTSGVWRGDVCTKKHDEDGHGHDKTVKIPTRRIPVASSAVVFLFMQLYV